MRSNGSTDADILLDRGLEAYVGATPRPGLDRRVMQHIRAAEGRAVPWFARPWALAAAAAALVIAAGVELWVNRGVWAAIGSGLLEWCQRLQATWLSTALRESELMWAYLEGTHLIGVSLMIGPAMMWDLRLIGVLWRRDPVSKIKAKFLRASVMGAALMVSTGLLLFISEPVKCYDSVYFRIKLVMLTLAALNVFVFHTTIDRKLPEWDTLLPPPPRARWAGILSLVFWSGVIFAGRYTAYNI